MSKQSEVACRKQCKVLLNVVYLSIKWMSDTDTAKESQLFNSTFTSLNINIIMLNKNCTSLIHVLGNLY